MPASTPVYLYLPGENERELWVSSEKDHWTRAGHAADARQAIQGVEVIALDSSPFFAIAPEGGLKALQPTIALRWESLGIDVEEIGNVFTSWEVAVAGDRRLIASTALCSDGLPEELLAREATGFEPSARLFPIPANSFAIWKELGRHVIAFTHGDTLVHACALSSSSLDQNAVIEIQQLIEALRAMEFIPPLSSGHLWTAADASVAEQLQARLHIGMAIEDKPAPRLPAMASDLLPAPVAAARMQHQRMRRLWTLLGAVGCLIMLFFAAWAGWLIWQEQHLETRLSRLAASQPEVDSVRQAQLRWSAAEQAVTPDSYPVEVFHQIVSLLPPEGIRFKDFSMDLEKIIISGEATSLIHASKFQADMKANSALQRYTFNAPQPTVLEDNRATFRMEGKLSQQGGLDETP